MRAERYLTLTGKTVPQSQASRAPSDVLASAMLPDDSAGADTTDGHDDSRPS